MTVPNPVRLRRPIWSTVAGISLVLAAAVLALAPATGASAHDYLVSSTPKADSTQTTELTEVGLTFDDRVLDLSGDGSSNVVEVTGPKGDHFETGCPTIADSDVTVPVALGESGHYRVTWQIVSADGHTVSSSIAFRYERPEAVTAAAGRDARPTCGDQNAGSGTARASDGGSAQSAQSSGSSAGGLGIALGVGGGIILAALIAVAVVLVRNRPAPPTAPEE